MATKKKAATPKKKAPAKKAAVKALATAEPAAPVIVDAPPVFKLHNESRKEERRKRLGLSN